MSSTSFLESERLYYRAPELTDVEIFTRWFNDPRIRLFLDHRVWPVSSLFEESWVRQQAEPPKNTRSDVVLVFGKKGEAKLIGSTGLHAINWIVREAEWGIVIGDPEDWDRGFGREVARRVLAYAFVTLNLNRVKLRVNASHPRGIACYESAGFVREGVLRQASYTEGRYEDLVMMAVIRDDWMQQRLPPPTPPAAPTVPSSKRARKSFRSRARR